MSVLSAAPCWVDKWLHMHACGCPGTAASCKTQFIRQLLAHLVAEGHRTLLFSQSRVMLDVISGELAARGVAFLRIDGTIASAAERQARLHAPKLLWLLSSSWLLYREFCHPVSLLLWCNLVLYR